MVGENALAGENTTRQNCISLPRPSKTNIPIRSERIPIFLAPIVPGGDASLLGLHLAPQLALVAPF